MKRSTTAIALTSVGLALLASGCLHRELSGHFAANAYYQKKGEYRVRLASDEPRALMPAPWHIVNFDTDLVGAPRAQQHAAPLGWEGPFGRERQSDARGTATRDDFVYTRAGRSVVWARSESFPMGLELDEILWLEVFGSPSAVRGVGFTIREDGLATVDGAPARLATVDVRAGHPRTVVERRVTLVAVRPPRPRRRGAADDRVILFACVSPLDRWHEDRVDFEAMLRRVDFAR